MSFTHRCMTDGTASTAKLVFCSLPQENVQYGDPGRAQREPAKRSPEAQGVVREGLCIHRHHAVPAARCRKGQALLQALQGVGVVHIGLHV